MKKHLYILLLIAIFSADCCANDTLQYMALKDLFNLILKNHPVARQAWLLDERAKQELRINKGNFDPALGAKYSEKEFSGQDYYRLWDSYLNIPTWWGINLQAGFTRNIGPYVNREYYTPTQGLSYIGISVPIAQGLLIDERRSALLQAKQLPVLAESERIKIINKLLLQAAKDYWDWMFYYNKLNLHKTGFELASQRFNAVKERVKYGDLSAIDTVEALTQAQNFEIQYTQSQVEYNNYRLIISNYMWNENNLPLELSEKVVPSLSGSELTVLSADSLESIVQTAVQRHPEMIKLNTKRIQLNIERRFLANKLLPKAEIQYNLLQKGIGNESDFMANNYLLNNYKVGISFSYPILLRAERGKYKLAGIKIQETDYQISQTNRDIEIEIRRTANEWLAYARQITLQEGMVKNAEALRNGEQVKFENGESSLFLINSRENYLISNQIKLFELQSKYAKTKTALQWAAGSVGNL